MSYFLYENNITKLTIDFQETVGSTTYREIQYSTIDKDGVLASFDTYIEQRGDNKPVLSKASQTLQVYTLKELSELLTDLGFKVVQKCAIDGSRFYETKTERILMVAKK